MHLCRYQWHPTGEGGRRPGEGCVDTDAPKREDGKGPVRVPLEPRRRELEL
jgi:hypothetical protein